ncbi:peroxide stress protein YaaA [Helicobacter sp. MIT 11-5569]|uniref:peroxide stress protein YaaA n=1 Tax=Helicobacter sp. MIT 11-5569 TaxID=1548151 RepID=UPI00051FB49B|nr:peroxide stress protein YaaA [Helicobacter sp. MIT 11-5569]TLD80338.1 peroxide stress protein YaaA [Helicobacter sp. MIT 11-5569]
MWILFSPSEKKCLTHKNSTKATKTAFYKDFICKNLQEILESYTQFLQHASDAELQKLFGVKTINLDELSLAQNLLNAPLLDSIERYIGVAFNALDYTNLDNSTKDYLHKHLLIFSNLFGILKAQDKIPYYDLKQGEGFYSKNTTFSTKNFYKENSENIWKFLDSTNTESLEFLDLRAGFYQKCFSLNTIPTTLKHKNLHIVIPNFIKNGKTLSHYAKFYRGILLQTCAKSKISDLETLISTDITGLSLQDKNTTNAQNITQTLLTYTIQ